MPIHQDARIYASLLSAGKSVELAIGSGRGIWVQLVRGGLIVNGQTLTPGDGAAIEGEPTVTLAAAADSEFLLFDLA